MERNTVKIQILWINNNNKVFTHVYKYESKRISKKYDTYPKQIRATRKEIRGVSIEN